MLTHAAMSLLARHTLLSPSEQHALESICGSPRRYPVRHDLLRAGDSAASVFVIVSGVACRFATLPGGHSQIYAYLLPGELCGLRGVVGLPMDHSIRALTALEACLIPRDGVRALCNEHPNISRALLRLSQIEAAISRQWLLNVGHRSAFAALAHLFCEVFFRMQAAGLTQENTCALPLTQTDLAEALALSPVHLNRTMMKMRRAGVATLAGGQLCIMDAEALKAAAKFDAAYLGETPLAAPADSSDEAAPGTRFNPPRSARSSQL